MSTIKTNALVAPKQFSTYVVAAIVGLATWWLNLPLVEQASMLSAFPKLIPLIPVISGAAWIVAKLWPQNVTVPAPAVEKPNGAVIDAEESQRGDFQGGP